MEMAFKGLLLEADPGLRKDRDLTDAHYWIQDPDEGKFEDAERYREGGYCPITMYQMLKNGRYRVAYKLGNGHHSTVWLAQDLQEGSKVALKILTADSSVNSSERDVLRIVTDTCASSPYVTELLDAFNITSANGNHQVLVMPTMRPIMTMRDMITSFPSVVKSLVEALDKIHSAGIIHGDIHTENLGCRFDLEDLWDLLPPELVPLPPVGDHRPCHIVSCWEWRDEEFTYESERIKGLYVPVISDFGNAYLVSKPGPSGGNPNAIPQAYTPPEFIFGKEDIQQSGTTRQSPLNQKTDIWALGAAIFELATGQVLSHSWPQYSKRELLRYDDRLAPGWEAELGPEYKESSASSVNEPIEDPGISSVDANWKKVFESGPRSSLLNVGDKQLCQAFLRDMTALDPNRRPLTQDLLRHPYLADVPSCVEIGSDRRAETSCDSG